MSFEKIQVMVNDKQMELNEITRERLDFLDKLILSVVEVTEDHEKVIQEQAKQIEKLTEQMNKLLEKA